MDAPADGHSKRPSSPEDSVLEARRLKAVRGPGIVALQGVGDGGELVLAKAACSLADVLHERGPLSEGETRVVGFAAAAALARVHAAGLVHGDVKPANLLLSTDGELWLSDFDAAAPADGRALARFSPGRLEPGAAARPAADIEALAITLVELSTGVLIDADVSWRVADLRRLGCPPALGADISSILEVDGSAPTAGSVAAKLKHGDMSPLPAPAARARCVDPTPTVEFMPSRPAPPVSLAPLPPHEERRWPLGSRLSVLLGSGERRAGPQESGKSHARRSS